MEKVMVYGSGGFARLVNQLAADCGYSVVGLIDDYRCGEGIIGPFTEAADRYPPEASGIVIGIGYSRLKARWSVYEKVKAAGYQLPALVHPTAVAADSAAFGDGTLAMRGVIVDDHAACGEMAVLWPGVVVSHDSKVGRNTFLSPNATVCGCAHIGDHCFIGAGAIIVDQQSLPDNSFVKAGSLYYERKTKYVTDR